jgi:hypothetical protein
VTFVKSGHQLSRAMKSQIVAITLLFSLKAVSEKIPGTSPRESKSFAFTENKGQVHDQFDKTRHDILFSTEVHGMTAHLRADGLSYQFSKVDAFKEEKDPKFNFKISTPALMSYYRLDVSWPGANKNVTIAGDDILPGQLNYYLSSCSAGVTGVREFRKIIYKDLYPGIHLQYYEKDGLLKYDYLLAAGADHTQIKIHIDGAQAIDVSAAGSLIIKTPLGNIEENAPLVMQEGRVLRSHWTINNNEIGIFIGDVDKNKPLIIDPPVRAWGTYYGGGADDRGYCVTSDASGNSFLCGETQSAGGTVMAT